MELNNKQVALLALFIIITGALSFNILGITGNTVKTTITTIDITPITIERSNNLQITINPGPEGTSKKIEFFHNGNKIGETPEICHEARCHDKTVIIYDIPRNWETGNYVAHLFDYSTADYVQDYFILR
ncbi:MAG: hypothetical protein Q7R56_00595 [Nanoarchaeota archaeon]|nr:hypothetical protein [Nanoarchaeota archaeon]